MACLQQGHIAAGGQLWLAGGRAVSDLLGLHELRVERGLGVRQVLGIRAGRRQNQHADASIARGREVLGSPMIEELDPGRVFDRFGAVWREWSCEGTPHGCRPAHHGLSL